MKRYVTVLVLILILFACLPIRIFYLVAEKESYPDVSNSLHKITISSGRGEIYDCRGEKLVNRKNSDVTVALPTEESAEILRGVITADEYGRLLDCIDKGELFICSTAVAKDNIYVKSEKKYIRYTDDGFCSHIVGYVNLSDNKGVSGIEKSYDDFLTKQGQRLVFQYNKTGVSGFLPGGDNRFVSVGGNEGSGVILTIDSRIQRICENAMKLYEIKKGAVVVMNALTGEILAMASAPSFNQNDVASYLNDEDSALVNRAVSSYSVGSVFKFVVAAAAIEEGVDTFESYCNGSVTVGKTTFSCSEGKAHGYVNIRNAFAHSCNTYFIRLALKIGSEKILRMAENLGFGKSFALAEGFSAHSGKLPEEITSDGMLANLSFGQGGLLATPLQVASCYSSAVNRGVFIQPSLVKGIMMSDGKRMEEADVRYRYRVMSAEGAEKLKNLLINNFTEGTCVRAKPENCVAGGKTSTAETGWVDETDREILHSWFSGFVQKGEEIYTITVFKEDGVSGSMDCGPVFKEICQRIMCEIL